MKLFILLLTISAVARAGEVEVKVLNTTNKTSPQEKKRLEKKVSEKMNKKAKATGSP